MLVAGRFINGICVGITPSQTPVYLAEIAKKESRGSMIVIQQWAIEWGIFIMYFVGYRCSFIKSSPTASFRTAWAIQFITCVILMLGIPLLPRLPRWLAKVGREKEAIAILADIQAGGNINDPLVIAEWEEITTILAAERKGQNGWRQFFKNGMWKGTLAGTSVQIWQQLSGADVMPYYMVYIFEMASLTGNIRLVSSGIQYAIFIIGTAATFFFIDKTGRRPLLVSSLTKASSHSTSDNYEPTTLDLRCTWNGYMHVCRRRSSWYTRYLPPPDRLNGNLSVRVQVSGSPAYTAIAFYYILVLLYSITLAPIAWLHATEVWSLETRATGMALAPIANWLFSFAIGLFIPSAFQNISWKLFIIFGVLCFAAATPAFFTYPETARKSLEEIELLFAKGGAKPWKTRPGVGLLDDRVSDVKSGAGIGGVQEERLEYGEKGGSVV